MDTSKIPVAPLFQEKLLLYKELAEVLIKEREWIVNADVDELWRISDAKNAIVAKIDLARSRILELLSDAGIEHGMIPETFQSAKVISLLPKPLRQELAGTQLSLGIIKEKVKNLSLENKKHIESYLAMLDDLISAISGRETTPPAYGARGETSKTNTPAIFHREV